MNKNSTTYRFFTLFMATVVAISVSLSSALLAVHCNMDMQQTSVSLTSGEYCPVMGDHSAHKNLEPGNHSNPNSNCDWILSCDYKFDQYKVTAEAIPSVTKTAKAFVLSVIQYVNTEPTKTLPIFTDAEIAPHSKIPPLFLLNSVFLN